jgi:hypothetical protein
MNDAPAVLPADDEQVNQVVKWILAGQMTFDIVGACKQHFPGADPGKLILGAMMYFDRQADYDSRLVNGWCFEASRELYRRMIEAGDYTGALRAVKQIQGMTGAANVPKDDVKDAEFTIAETFEGGHGI